MIQYLFMGNEQTHPLHETDKNIIDSLITKKTPEDLDYINLARLINRYTNFTKEIEIKKLNKILDDLNKSPLILATNISDSQVFFEIQGKNSFDILNKLTHFDFREKSFKKSTAAQTLLARVDCSIFNLDLKLLLSCNRSFADSRPRVDTKKGERRHY